MIETQLQRIKEKLVLAKNTDIELEVFGADDHLYELNPPLSTDKILQFELEYGIQVPNAYKEFITKIAYVDLEKEKYDQVIAGPYYGIMPLEFGLKELETEQPKRYLSFPCLLYPKMSSDQWNTLNEQVFGDRDAISDLEYDVALGKLYGGLLPIGTQGCAITSALVLNGEHTGRIVYFDGDNTPVFTHENNFLDWYERWLDEIIEGELMRDNAPWFAYNKGGSAEQLWNEFIETNDHAIRLDCLHGLLSKKALPPAVLHNCIHAITSFDTDITLALLRIAAKNDYTQVREVLFLFAENHLLHILQTINWYAKNEAIDWVPIITKYIDTDMDEDTFAVCTALLLESKVDFVPIIQNKLSHSNTTIRIQAYYSIGQLPNKVDYLHLLKKGLEETDEKVLMYVLQAVGSINDPSLLPYYDTIAARFGLEEDTVIGSNLIYGYNTLKQDTVY